METTRQMVQKMSDNFDRRQRETEAARLASLSPAEKLRGDIETMTGILAKYGDDAEGTLQAAIDRSAQQLAELTN